MKRAQLNKSAVILLCAFFAPILATAQTTSDSPPQEPPEVAPTLDKPEGYATENVRRSCMSAPDNPTAEFLVEQASSGLPELDRSWLEEDVSYIISPIERCAFLLLALPEEREQFKTQFWLRRSANPDSPENDFEVEHYRRIIFANDHFATDLPGWKTDRGHMHIIYGPPDKIESHGAGEAPLDTSSDPSNDCKCSWEQWSYRYLEGIAQNVVLQFVNQGFPNDFELRKPPAAEASSIFAAPKIGDVRDIQDSVDTDQFERLELINVLSRSPDADYKGMEALLVSRIDRSDISFEHRIDLTRATRVTTLASIVVDVPVAQLSPANGVPDSSPGYEIFGRLTKANRVVFTFDSKCKLAEEKESQCPDIHRNPTVALEPGVYELGLAVKDTLSGNSGVLFTNLQVP
jgi:GWxTD domain-containing protein